MQPKTSIGIALALLARGVSGQARDAVLGALAPPLRAATEAALAHVEQAPAGSAERVARIKGLSPAVAHLRAWPTDARVGAILGAAVEPLAPRPCALPLPRRRYRLPSGLKEALLHQARTAEGAWPG